MESLSSQVLVIVSIFLLIYLPWSQSSTFMIEKKGNLIENTCRRTHNYDLCVSSLRSDPHSSKADVKGLSRIMLELSIAKAKATLSYIHLLNNKATDRIWKRYFSGCIEQYVIADKVLGTAIVDLDSNDYGDSTTNAHYAGEAAQDCEDVFKGPPETRKSPLTNQNNALNDLSDVAADIVYILVTGPSI